ncbi:class III lanthipeptide [Staphylococcus pseudintermedius]|nr:class III lanthipeptide [Staphylococcus pseudintermedius]EHL7207215.1 class III lanthipeptide [Staphylococcus pseudintermedius]EHP0459702.1 class III lanthipeptide [Staphylococcus pseudintermedius]EHP0513243.1 class III lanthipeptide [Staphylococcus pseudintermedius]EHS7171493.1 class III lanthipeptide [Staphylococcus pseudintermedius]EHS7221945.1 class III lanthipeptide [Staphylococcus pseudintermedius]
MKNVLNLQKFESNENMVRQITPIKATVEITMTVYGLSTISNKCNKDTR